MDKNNDARALRFSDVQNRLITSSLTVLCCLVLGVCVVVFGFLCLRAMSYLVHIIGPVIAAFFLSLLTRPWYAKLRQWMGGRDFLAVTLFSLSFLIPIVLFCWFFGAFVLEQGSAVLRAVPRAITQLHDWIITAVPDSEPMLRDWIPQLRQYLTADGSLSMAHVSSIFSQGMTMGGAVFSAGSATLLWLLTFFYWIIFVMQAPLTGKGFAARIPFLSDHGRAVVASHFANFIDIITSYFRGQIIDVVIQGFIYGTIFQCIGIPSGFTLGFTVGILNLVPYIGILTGLAIVLPLAFLHGGLGLLIASAVIFCCVQSFDGYIMQPYIQGGRMKLSAWQIVFALLFWTQIAGFLGLLLAIPLTAFVKASWGGWLASSERFMETPPTPPTKKEKVTP